MMSHPLGSARQAETALVESGQTAKVSRMSFLHAGDKNDQGGFVGATLVQLEQCRRELAHAEAAARFAARLASVRPKLRLPAPALIPAPFRATR